MKRLVLAAVLVITALPSFANPITFETFAFQQSGLVPLGPGLDPLLVPAVVMGNPILSFETEFGSIGDVVSSYTLDVPGYYSTLGPFTFVCNDPTGCGDIYGWMVPLTYQVTPGTLSATLNGVTEAYAFQYQLPAPEPTTLTLLGIGSVVAIRRKHICKHR
jgi:hypothetical protein